MRKEGNRLVIEAQSRPTLAEIIDWLRAQPPLEPGEAFEIDDLPLLPTDEFGNEVY